MRALDGASSYSDSTIGFSSYDVFLNFRGEDTRNNFTGFLNLALKDKGINVFLDSEKLWIGEAIGPALSRAIKGSKISIPVFSKSYAYSKWCLHELAQIVQCHRSNGQLILPIFFYIDPSHVRNQTGSFRAAFEEHEKNFIPDIVESWRDALAVVGNLKGEVVDETKNQAMTVELVVQRALDELVSSTKLAECKYRVGIDSHVEDLLSLLNIGSGDDVQFVGICGLSGIGKTTIAKAVYNRIFKSFGRHSFLSDIREHATQWMGLVSLQKRLLKDILKTDIDVCDYHRGKKLIEERLCREKVLLVLDDVDSQEQVNALIGEFNWFGQGSRIIITTRDECILNVAKVDKDKVYWPQELDHKQSLQLFSLHAFQRNQPPENYMQLSCDVASYSGGLPLTLEVFGSYLSGISDKEEWESTLQKLKEIPPKEVQRRLQISYDSLDDDYQKAIFLDAACFLVGWEKETAISLWEACGFYPRLAIRKLIKRSLLKFEEAENGEYYLKMHDQIQDMGRNIVKEESPIEPSRRSRLWSSDDILEVLGQKGTDMIQGIRFKFLRLRSVPRSFSWEDFEMMSNLRILGICNASFMGDFSSMPSSLRYIRWECYSYGISKSLPTNFYHKRLVHLKLSIPTIEQAWNTRPRDGNERFPKLKVLDLSYCTCLSKSPNFSWFPYLERLDLGYCESLDKLDESIGQLSELKCLILQFCKSLVKLPDGLGLLQKIEVLDAKCCHMLGTLPRSMRGMRSLRSINLQKTNISELPNDFSMHLNLVELEISWCSRSFPVNLLDFKRLERLKLYECKKLEYIPELPSSLVKLLCEDCHSLIHIPELPLSLVELCCEDCYSLVRLPELSRLKFLTTLKFKDCKKLEVIRGLEGITESCLEILDARGCCNLTRTPMKICGQGTLLPDRTQEDNSFSLTAHDGFHNNKGLILCIIFKFPSDYIDALQLQQSGLLLTIDLDISASIHQKDSTIWCHHTLRIEEIEFTIDRDIIYIHHFNGFDWFGIPLQGKDSIENLYIRGSCPIGDDVVVKFWEVFFQDWEPDQQKPDQQSGAMMVADFFNWYGGTGVTSLNPISLKRLSRAEVEGSNSAPEDLEEDGVLMRASNCKRPCLNDEDHDASHE